MEITLKNWKHNWYIKQLYHSCLYTWRTLSPHTTCISLFIATLFTVIKKWNYPWYTLMWMDKENVTSIHNEILYNHKEKWNYDMFRKMDAARKDFIKWNMPLRRNYFVSPLMCAKHICVYVYVCLRVCTCMYYIYMCL